MENSKKTKLTLLGAKMDNIILALRLGGLTPTKEKELYDLLEKTKEEIWEIIEEELAQ